MKKSTRTRYEFTIDDVAKALGIKGTILKFNFNTRNQKKGNSRQIIIEAEEKKGGKSK